MRKLPLWQQTLTQVVLLMVAAFTLLPIWSLLRLALDGAIKSIPTSVSLLPAQPTLEIFMKVWRTPSQSLSFLGLLRNSLLVSASAAVLSVILGTTMAYAFARFRFRGRQAAYSRYWWGRSCPW